MRRRFLLLVAFPLIFFFQGRSQADLIDPLGSAFRISAQSKLRSKLPAASCAIVFSGGFQAYDPLGDHPLPFTCDPDFYYLTGYRLPDAALVVFAEPRTLAEGSVQSIVFLPDKNDHGLSSMGYEYRGKFGLQEGGIALRPAGQWRKFCAEVLASESVSKVFTKPARFSTFHKPGGSDFWDMGYKLYAALAPGYPFDPQAQRFYKDILAADSAAMLPLASRIAAAMEYQPSMQRDPLLERFSKLTRPELMAPIQAEIRRIKIDLVQYECCLRGAMQEKTEAELALLRKAAAVLAEAFRAGASRAAPGKTEAAMQAAATYVAQLRGAALPMPVVAASGKHCGQPNYVANTATLPQGGAVTLDLAVSHQGYVARVTRTLPLGGAFPADHKALYDGVLAIHQKNIRNCVAGGLPSKLQEAAASSFDALDKQLIFSTNALGARKVLRVNGVVATGLALDEGLVVSAFRQGQVLTLETALYLPDEEGVTAKWRGMGVVLRDLIWIGPEGPQVLTQAIPTAAAELQALCAAPIRLPEE